MKPFSYFLLILIVFNYSICSRSDLFSIPALEGLDRHCGVIPEEEGAQVYEPWSVAIFTKSDKKGPKGWTYFGEGILLTKTTVLTTAELFINDDETRDGLKIGNLEDYLVVAGLPNRMFPSQPFEQDLDNISPVSFIGIHEEALSQDLANSVAIIHLRKELVYDIEYLAPFIFEVCLPPYEKLPLPGDLISMRGFINPSATKTPQNNAEDNDSNNNTRSSSHLIIQNSSFCEEKWNFFTNKKDDWKSKGIKLNCAVPTKDDGISRSIYPKPCHKGTAATFALKHAPTNKTQHFVTGLFLKHFEVYQSTEIRNCTPHSLYFYLNLEKHLLSWIHQNIKCGPWRFSCSSPQGKCLDMFNVCDGRKDCDKGEDENPQFCTNFKKCNEESEFKCGPLGKCISKDFVCDNQYDCVNGEDEAASLCHLSPSDDIPSSCPPLNVHESIKASCVGGDRKEYDCSFGGIPGSKVTLQCQQFYTSKEQVSILESKCLESGKWHPPIQSFSCKIECGRNNAKVQGLIKNGVSSSSSSWPWHGMLYERVEDGGSNYKCGMTLISPSILLTAAHCFLPQGEEQNFQPQTHEVVLGSSYSDYSRSNTSQRFRIDKVSISPAYNQVSLEGDVAVVKLEGKAKLTANVRPACFPFPGYEADLLETYQLIPGVIGHVVGFGLDASDEISEELQSLSLPFISSSECADSLDRTIPPTQFCAGYKNGSGTCLGDSGGGILFSQGTLNPIKLFIQGIVSHSQPIKGTSKCNTNNYAIYTKISSYANWITQQIYHFQT